MHYRRRYDADRRSDFETGSECLVCPFESGQPAFMAKTAGHPDVRIRVNRDLQIISAGTHEEIYKEADRVIALIGGRAKTTLGTGAFVP